MGARPGHYGSAVAVVLVTGMSATGKSTVLAELARRGHAVVDTDERDWCEEVDGERLWRVAPMEALLDEHAGGTLVVSGTVANQGWFYGRFDTVVLLSAPLDVILDRVRTRATNDFGKSDAERARIGDDHAVVEPLLRAGATVELDTRRPLADVVAELESIVTTEGASGRRS